MKFAVVSDLHLEMRNDKNAIIRLLQRCMVDADYLFVAGDVVSGRYLPDLFLDFMGALCSHYKNVFYVPGNHEYWHSSFDKINGELWDAQVQIKNLCVLQNALTSIEGKNIYGGTLWFPRSLKSEAYKRNWPDFAYCKDAEDNIYNEANKFRAYFPSGDVDIVMTHHLPSPKSIAPYWKGNETNCYFVNDVEDLMPKVKVWIHGHTHSSFNYMLGDCKVICNPLGAPSEQSSKKYQPLILEI